MDGSDSLTPRRARQPLREARSGRTVRWAAALEGREWRPCARLLRETEREGTGWRRGVVSDMLRSDPPARPNASGSGAAARGSTNGVSASIVSTSRALERAGFECSCGFGWPRRVSLPLRSPRSLDCSRLSPIVRPLRQLRRGRRNQLNEERTSESERATRTERARRERAASERARGPGTKSPDQERTSRASEPRERSGEKGPARERARGSGDEVPDQAANEQSE